MVGFVAVVAALLVAPIGVRAEPIDLALPLDCTLGETCHIQNYVDHDPGPGFADFTCGDLGYESHGGTDFALPNLSAMEAGVDVLAAAPGVVMGTRDGMPDISFRDEDAPDLAARECGNGVSIDHGGGWATQYCHLARGTLAVRPGQEVERGRRLGRVGLSGQTEFPHLHFTVRRDDAVVDPFDAAGGPCGGPAVSLWTEDVAYAPTGVIGAGLLDRVPEWAEVTAGSLGAHPGDPHAPLVLWAHAFGGRVGDRVTLRVDGPGGAVIERSRRLDDGLAAHFAAQGAYPPEGGWPPGTYTGRVEIARGEAIHDSAETRLRIGRRR